MTPDRLIPRFFVERDRVTEVDVQNRFPRPTGVGLCCRAHSAAECSASTRASLERTCTSVGGRHPGWPGPAAEHGDPAVVLHHAGCREDLDAGHRRHRWTVDSIGRIVSDTIDVSVPAGACSAATSRSTA